MSVLFYRIHTVCSIQFYFINKIITEKKTWGLFYYQKYLFMN